MKFTDYCIFLFIFLILRKIFGIPKISKSFRRILKISKKPLNSSEAFFGIPKVLKEFRLFHNYGHNFIKICQNIENNFLNLFFLTEKIDKIYNFNIKKYFLKIIKKSPWKFLLILLSILKKNSCLESKWIRKIEYFIHNCNNENFKK